jgi:hypothetical protein
MTAVLTVVIVLVSSPGWSGRSGPRGDVEEDEDEPLF